MELPSQAKAKYDNILATSSINAEIGTLQYQEKKEIKAYAIKKALKLKRYVRN